MNVEKKRDVRSRFSSEFKANAVALVLDEGGSVAGVARSLGLASQTLWSWVRQAQVDRGEKNDSTSDEKRRLVELVKENRQLRMERNLLK